MNRKPKSYRMPQIDIERLIGKSITLTVNMNLRGLRRARARLMVGKWLVRLAACVMGCGIVVNDGKGQAKD